MRVGMSVAFADPRHSYPPVILAITLTRWAYGCVIFEMLIGTPPFGDRKFVRPSHCPVDCCCEPAPPSSTPVAECAYVVRVFYVAANWVKVK